MELTMSMFATQADYWKARAELAEKTVQETAQALGCEPDNEAMLMRAGKLRETLQTIRLATCDYTVKNSAANLRAAHKLATDALKTPNADF